MRKKRDNEYTCWCSAYGFPHRFGGGRCSGYCIAVETWQHNYGGGECRGCNCAVEGECQVVNGTEAPKHGDCVVEFVGTEGINTPTRAFA